jgi:hypothetical protein
MKQNVMYNKLLLIFSIYFIVCYLFVTVNSTTGKQLFEKPTSQLPNSQQYTNIGVNGALYFLYSQGPGFLLQSRAPLPEDFRGSPILPQNKWIKSYNKTAAALFVLFS